MDILVMKIKNLPLVNQIEILRVLVYIKGCDSATSYI